MSGTAREKQTKGREAGFSLLELMVALTILALSVGIVGVGFARSSVSFRFDAAAQELALNLREAHARALRSGRDVAVVVDADARAYRLQGDPTVQLPEGTDIRIVSAGEAMDGNRRPVIAFSPEGGSTGGSINLALDGRTALITVDWLTGDVTLTSGAADADRP
jgi:general secretion pathway protein H